MAQTFPNRYRDGLDRVLAAVRDISDHQRSGLANRHAVAQNVQAFLAASGVDVSLAQAEEIYALYSFDKFASWMVGGDTVDDAGLAVIDLCASVQAGENHVGL